MTDSDAIDQAAASHARVCLATGIPWTHRRRSGRPQCEVHRIMIRTIRQLQNLLRNAPVANSKSMPLLADAVKVQQVD